MKRVIVTAPTALPTGSFAPVLPYSKSLCNRVLTIQALSWMDDGRIDTAWCERLGRGLEVIHPQSDKICDDTKAMLTWLQRAHLLQNDTIDVGAAGTAMRFSTALLAMMSSRCVLTGSPRMKERPIAVLVDALRSLGADINYLEREGFPPLLINGHRTEADACAMHGGALTLPGNVSSQYISALLMIAPKLEGGLHLHLEGEVISRPYIDMTLHEMNRAGAKASWVSDRDIWVEQQPYQQDATPMIEDDWSAASYWYELLALGRKGSRVLLHHLQKDSTQGDRRIADIFTRLGVQTNYLQDPQHTVELTHTGKVCTRLDWDFIETPDLAQTVVVTCCMLGVPFRFTGLQTLKIKETDRIVALQNEMAKLGFQLGCSDRELWWNGEKSVVSQHPEPVIDTYKDHRMAMAFAPCSLRWGHIAINDPDVVAKSYPGFWNELQRQGFDLESMDV